MFYEEAAIDNIAEDIILRLSQHSVCVTGMSPDVTAGARSGLQHLLESGHFIQIRCSIGF
jgi:hypothetical protein